MKLVREERYIEFDEVRADQTEEGMKVGGYAAVFNRSTEIHPRLKEVINPGAFAASLTQDDIRALWNHNTDMPIGRTTAPNSLKLWEDREGLAFDLNLPDTTAGNDTYKNIKSGLVTGMSFGFAVQEDQFTKGENGQPHVRTLKKLKLYEVSPVTFPAYKQTSVKTRDIEAMLKEVESEWMYEERDEETDRDKVRRLLAKLEREAELDNFLLV